MRFQISPFSTRLLAVCLALATPGQSSALLEAQAWAAEQVLFYHNDAVGSPVAMTNSTGAVVWRADYEPFGGVVRESGTASTTHRFTGKERDAEIGLDYFGARYYDASLGRFLSIDPVLDVGTAFAAPQRWNRFAYALNSPFRYGDPDGRDAVVLHGGFIGGPTGVQTLSDTVRRFFPPRNSAAIPRAIGPGRYAGDLRDHPGAGVLFAENHVHESGPRILAGWSLGGDAALAAGPPHGGGTWDLRVVVGASVERNIVQRIDKAARTSDMVVIVALRGDTFGGDRSYESLVFTLRGAFGSLDGFYEYYPNVQVEPSDASHLTGGGNDRRTQEAIRRGVKTVSERILRQQRAQR